MADRYCTECGKALGPDDKFCTGCGAEVKEWDEYDAQAQPAPATASTYEARTRSSSLKTVMILTLIWGILAVIAATDVFLTTNATIDAIKEALIEQPYEGSNMWDYMVAQGVTEDTWRLMLYTVGGTFAFSGATALISAFFMYKRINYTPAMVLLLASAISAIMGIVTLVVGLIVFIMFTKCKDEFTS